MTTYEDPVFLKAIRLLHSPAKDSADQIMQLLEEAVEQKYGGSRSLNLRVRQLLEEPSSFKSSSRSGSPSAATSRGSTPPSEVMSSRPASPADLDDGDLSIFEDEITCFICKSFQQGPDNKLVECSDCHHLYHQECHKPMIDDVEASDKEWTCSECTKKAKSKSGYSEPPPAKKAKTEHEKSSSRKKEDKSSHVKSSQSKSTSKEKLNFLKPPGSPNGKAAAPANILAADRRLQNMKKKAAAKMHEKRSNPK